MTTFDNRPGIHGGCKCPRTHWVVVHRNCNYSAFNGYHWTPSDYSMLHCHHCGHIWRTKAKYVGTIPDGKLIQVS